MKKAFFLLFLAAASLSASAQFVTTHVKFTSEKNSDIDEEDCAYRYFAGGRTIFLWGKVYRAKPGEKADLTIREARKGETPHMLIGIVQRNPDECGLWQWTDNRKEASFSVRIVRSGGNIVVSFRDGEKLRTEYEGIPCYDWSSGRPEPCK